MRDRRRLAPQRSRRAASLGRAPLWLFDLDNTLHDASAHAFKALNRAMTGYIEQHLQLDAVSAAGLRQHYWQRYGATLIGLVRHHGVSAAHFLSETHALPGLEAQLRCHAHDRAALRRLPGRKVLLTNAPLAYALRVLRALDLLRHFDAVLAIEHMAMFGELRPKPDARMLRHVCARLKQPATACVLVEDTLEHQKSARRIGMQTVWMQRWARAASPGKQGLRRRPVYVDRRVSSLMQLL
ncbi:pyrimidine 5'-nucleotidase [Paucibacter sp. APW11]|uniref:Pyrimidine 5'-nucleotidase n=1 Tax=Roseateles aquae TaxID=3077235 RepID=A0ABU3PDG2_9BURK|nr:pyrimidine 5'-nucleotidase [Paucibacter sp. APW11]MDT9000357.1 pyrimidine 5'-nucleotidase [Paucibacter sp. APW11]